MNLIEQLGGYEKAKVVLAEYIVNTLTPSQIGAKYGVWPFTIQILTDALLQHRREHGIYEIGDKVVLINSDDSDVFEYVEYSKGLDLHFFENKHNYGHAKLSNVRHATDAEIKANERLEVGNAD